MGSKREGLVTGAKHIDKHDTQRVQYLGLGGEVLPSATDVLGKTVNPEPLMAWARLQVIKRVSAWDQGQAARDGTRLHALAEHVLGHGNAAPEPEDNRAVLNGLATFRRWWLTQTDWEVLAVELSMVHDALGVGGTTDLILRHKPTGATCIGDLKTGKAVYPEHLAQVGGYGLMLTEGRLNHSAPADMAHLFGGPPIDMGLIIHIPKDGSDVGLHPVDKYHMAVGRDLFVSAVDLCYARGILRTYLDGQRH